MVEKVEAYRDSYGKLHETHRSAEGSEQSVAIGRLAEFFAGFKTGSRNLNDIVRDPEFVKAFKIVESAARPWL